MAVTLYFGLPGVGKTSVASQICVDEAYKIKMGQSNYSCVITNAPISCEDVYYTDDFSWFGSNYVDGALYVIDEATLLWDSRNYKVFARGLVKGFVLHRHTKNDVIIFVQIWNRLDKTIRDICDRVYYLHKGVIFKGLTYMNRIPYRVLFPDNGDNAGDIVMGYQKCSFWSRISSKRLARKYYYSYFDTFWIPEDMKPLPMWKLDKFWEHSKAAQYPPDLLDKICNRMDKLSLILHFNRKD